MGATSVSLGKSNMQGRATGLATPLLDMSKRTPCLVYGPGLLKEETHFISSNRLQKFIHKCAVAGLTVVYPKAALKAEINRIGALTFEKITPTEAPVRQLQPCFDLKSYNKPCICMNTGDFFLSAELAGKAFKLVGASISYQIIHGKKTLKGYSFRYATPEEINEAMYTPDWKFQGPLLPIDPVHTRAKRK